jgi:hypothetical protein
MTARNTRTHDEDDDDTDGPIFDPSLVVDGEDQDDLIQKIKHIRAGIGQTEPIKIRLRKKEGSKWPYIDELDTEEPNTHEIGLKHGAGEYQIYITWIERDRQGESKTKTATQRFFLGKHYDRLKKEQEEQERFMSSSGDKVDKLMEMVMRPQQNDRSLELMMTMMQSQSNQFQTMMLENAKQMQEAQRRADESRNQLMQTLITVAMPVVTALVSKPAPEHRESIADKLVPQLLNRLTEQKETPNPIQQLKDMKELMDMMKPESTTAEKTWIDVVENLASAVIENAPLIVSSFTPKALVQQQMTAQIAENPQYGQILDDDEKFRMFVTRLREGLKDDQKVRLILEKSGKLEKAEALGCFAQILA